MSEPDPLAAVFTDQIARRYPLATIPAVARAIGVPDASLYAYCNGTRTPPPDTIRDVLGKLDADEATIASALALWASKQTGIELTSR